MFWTMSALSPSQAFAKHSLLWAFNCLTEIYPNPLFVDFLKILEESEMTWEGPSRPLTPRGPPHLHLPPQLHTLTSWPSHWCSDPQPSAPCCHPLGHPSAQQRAAPPSHCRRSFHIVVSPLPHSLHLASFPLRKLLWQGTGVCQGDAGREGPVLSFLSEEPSVTR